MIRKLGILSIACFAVLLVGCGKSKHEKAMEEMVAVLNEMADIMSTIEDEETAQAAQSEMNALAGRMQKLSQLKTTDTPSHEELAELEKKYMPQIQKAMERFMQESLRLMMLDGMDESAMQDMLAQMNK